jgi:uncharacterized membrane protein (UPF0127 family)
VLAADARVARSLRAQLIGLIGREIGGDEALGLPRCSRLHTFFLRQPLDAVFCDSAGRALAIHADIPPFALAGRRGGAAIVWEARAGTLAPFVGVGDVLGLEVAEVVVLDTG